MRGAQCSRSKEQPVTRAQRERDLARGGDIRGEGGRRLARTASAAVPDDATDVTAPVVTIGAGVGAELSGSAHVSPLMYDAGLTSSYVQHASSTSPWFSLIQMSPPTMSALRAVCEKGERYVEARKRRPDREGERSRAPRTLQITRLFEASALWLRRSDDSTSAPTTGMAPPLSVAEFPVSTESARVARAPSPT